MLRRWIYEKTKERIKQKGLTPLTIRLRQKCSGKKISRLDLPNVWQSIAIDRMQPLLEQLAPTPTRFAIEFGFNTWDEFINNLIITKIKESKESPF